MKTPAHGPDLLGGGVGLAGNRNFRWRTAVTTTVRVTHARRRAQARRLRGLRRRADGDGDDALVVAGELDEVGKLRHDEFFAPEFLNGRIIIQRRRASRHDEDELRKTEQKPA